MIEYRVFVALEIANQIRSSRSRAKRQILDFLESLEVDPFQEGDFTKQQDGITIQIKVFGRFALYYWPDHAVKEVKIIALVKSDF